MFNTTFVALRAIIRALTATHHSIPAEAGSRALTLLGRDGCHLCEDMRAALKPWAARFHFAVEEVDITGKAELEARYGWDIPVLLAGETEICRHFLDAAALQSWITRQA